MFKFYQFINKYNNYRILKYYNKNKYKNHYLFYTLLKFMFPMLNL